MSLTPVIPLHKPLKPLIYSHLVTSTPDSYQASKRVKGLLGYSEHCKRSHFQDFFSLRSRDYRRAQELSLELWDLTSQAKHLAKFLRSQRNLKKIKIRIFWKAGCKKGNLKRFWRDLWRVDWLNRVEVDFPKEQISQAISSLAMMKSRMPLSKLKDLAITIGGEEVYPFSASLLKVGFEFQRDSVSVKDPLVVEKLMKRALKFDQLDTIKVGSKRLVCFSEEFLDGLLLVISKLPHLRELDFNYSRDLYLPTKQTFKILDVLVKAPNLKVLMLGLQMKGLAQASMLQHSVFKAKSLEKIHLSLFLYREVTPMILSQTLDVLQGMSSLYELYLDFSNYPNMNHETAKGLMSKVVGMTSIRKLKIVFSYHTTNLSSKQTGNILQKIFNKMVFLEELHLRLPQNGLELDANEEKGDIQGLTRLTKVSLTLRECEPEMEKIVWRVMGLLGKSLRLKELELDLSDSVYDFAEMPRKCFEIFGKLKGLQVLKLKTSPVLRDEEVPVSLLRDFIWAFGRMRSLQDWSLDLGIDGYDVNENEKQEIRDVCDEILEQKKYRLFNLGPGLPGSFKNSYF